MCASSRERHRSAVESINLGGHSISCDRLLRVLWRRRDRDLLWIPQPPAKYVQGEVLGCRVCCVGYYERLISRPPITCVQSVVRGGPKEPHHLCDHLASESTPYFYIS
ncbi:hypothetical protein AVEN_122967-1 [Araneus ventricosus]|uniref:Uncharacterized protein n=1 Tax=Araneus ventricosus TaxID=182803 RepID=A0A4Y2VI43_ARAVE|nr:hypothetical protein AVEN_122967-1 [Araneus ventricosus]